MELGARLGRRGDAAVSRTVRTEVDELAAALCELAGQIHAATAELVRLLGRLDAVEGWQGVGIRSLGHWASIYLGIDLRTAAQQARVGRQLDALPAIGAAADAGELGWSKLRLVAKVAEPDTETKWLELAREMSVGQLGRVVGAYRRASDTDDPDRSENHRERRGIWLFDEPDGLVRVTGLLEPDDAAVLRAALAAHAELLWRQGPRLKAQGQMKRAPKTRAASPPPPQGIRRGLRRSTRRWRPAIRRRAGGSTPWCRWPGRRWPWAAGPTMATISPRCCWSSTTMSSPMAAWWGAASSTTAPRSAPTRPGACAVTAASSP
jgi:Domain of unknown function (DUF222)